MNPILTTTAAMIAATSLAPAAVIQFDLQGVGGPGLLPTNEQPDPATGGTPGTGGELGSGIEFDDVSKVLTISVGWGSGNGFTDLSGDAFAAHIHGNADQTDFAGVLFDMGSGLDGSATDGTINYSTPALDAGQEADLFAGLWYVNVHTDANSGGEIRGNIVPEPASMLLGGLGFLPLLRRRR